METLRVVRAVGWSIAALTAVAAAVLATITVGLDSYPFVQLIAVLVASLVVATVARTRRRGGSVTETVMNWIGR